MTVDLHTHSTASDGSEKPGEVVRLAAEAGLSALALTDHDVLAGLAEAKLAADQFGIELIPGVELSLDWSSIRSTSNLGGGMHLVVLWLDDVAGPLADQLSTLREGRDQRNLRILQRLADLGLDVPLHEVQERAGTGSVGRPHIAGVMVDRGYVPDITTAFELYLGNRGPAYVDRPRLSPAEAIDLAVRAGGVPVLAHPQTLGFDIDSELERVLGHLKELGLVGVETHHSALEPDQRRLLRRMVARVGLAPSGGSDFHGAYKPGVALGVGCGDLEVPDEFLEELRLRRPAP